MAAVICTFDVCLLSIALIFDLGISEGMTVPRGFQAYVTLFDIITAVTSISKNEAYILRAIISLDFLHCILHQFQLALVNSTVRFPWLYSVLNLLLHKKL